jgi:general secretion pathway protein D
MQAPRITLLNGQAADLHVGEEENFLTGAAVVWNGEKFVLQPKKETIFCGLLASLGTIVSADLRSVYLYLAVTETNLDPKRVTTAPAVLSVPCDPTGASTPRILQAIEMPKLTKHKVEKKLTLPEGKTAVLFGWKQTTEVTDAVPVLSKLAYIGKHYQRVHQEPETVLVLVTPRVVVPEKTEEVLPTKACEENQAVKRAGCAEERVAPPNVDDLLTKYHAACAAGKFEKARKIAVRALKMDPTCFDRKR